MKKQIAALMLSVSLFTACTGVPNKWDYTVPEFTEKKLEERTERLEDRKKAYKEEKTAESTFSLALAYNHLWEMEEAEKYYLEALELAPNDYVTLNNLASVYELVGETQLAADTISRLFEINTSSIEVIRDTVRILLANNEPEKAFVAVETYATVVLDPESPDSEQEEFIQSLYADINDYLNETIGSPQ